MPSRKGCKNKAQNPLTLKDMYKVYMEGVDPGSKFDIGWKQYKHLAKAILNKIMNYILEGREFKLPFNLGLLRIRKYKTLDANKKPDFYTYQKTGIKTYFTNLDSKGYYPRFFWKRNGISKVRGLRVYSFRPNWFRRKEMSALFKNGQDYLE